jgi:hypothetical protein
MLKSCHLVSSYQCSILLLSRLIARAARIVTITRNVNQFIVEDET